MFDINRFTTQRSGGGEWGKKLDGFEAATVPIEPVRSNRAWLVGFYARADENKDEKNKFLYLREIAHKHRAVTMQRIAMAASSVQAYKPIEKETKKRKQHKK